MWLRWVICQTQAGVWYRFARGIKYSYCSYYFLRGSFWGIKWESVKLLPPLPRFKDIEELNRWLLEQCIANSKKRKHPVDKDRTIWEVFQEEQSTLIPTLSPFDGFSEKECRVSKNGLVGYDRNHYSVDCKLSGKTAMVRASATRVQVVKDGVIMADHARVFDRDKTVYLKVPVIFQNQKTVTFKQPSVAALGQNIFAAFELAPGKPIGNYYPMLVPL